VPENAKTMTHSKIRVAGDRLSIADRQVDLETQPEEAIIMFFD
jgi:hypothetical protein